MEIIDNAWLEILRRYPEVQEEMPGRNMIIRRNKNLDVECHPSSQFEKTQAVTAMCQGGNYVFAITATGSFSILSSETGKFVANCQVFQEDVVSTYVQTVLSNPTPLSPRSSCRVAVLRIMKLPPPTPDPESDAEKEKKAKAAQAAAKKTPKGGKAPEPEVVSLPPPSYCCSVTLIDCTGCLSLDVGCSVSHSFHCAIASPTISAELSMDGRALTLCCGLDISLFKFPPLITDTLAMAHIPEIEGDEMNELKVGTLDSMSARGKKFTEPTARWDMKEEIIRQAPPHYKDEFIKMFQYPLPLPPPPSPPPLVPLSAKEAAAAALLAPPPVVPQPKPLRVLSCHLFSFNSELRWDDPAPAPAMRTSHPASGNVTPSLPQLPPALVAAQDTLRSRAATDKEHLTGIENGVIVFLDDAKRWFIFALRTGQASTTQPLAEVAPSAALKKMPTLEQIPAPLVTNEQKPNRPLVLELLRHFTLSSVVSMVHMDERKTVLVIGQEDGVVSLWDIRSMLPLSAPTKHNSPVTCACLTSGIRSHLLVTGDLDGVLKFHKVFVSTSAGSLSLGPSFDSLDQFNNESSSQSCLKAAAIDVRMDFTRESIVSIWPLGGGLPIVVIQISSGRFVVYDAESAELMGRLCLHSGIPGQRLEYSLVRLDECIIKNEPIPVDLGDSPEVSAPLLSGVQDSNEEDSKPKFQIWRERVAVAGSCSTGFSAYFNRPGMKPVISSFNSRKIIAFLFPGVATLSTKAKCKAMDVILLYKLLTPAQRMDKHLKVSHVLALRETGQIESATSSAAPTPSIRTTTAKLGSNAKPASTPNSLTAEHLKELARAYQPLETPPILPSLALCSESKLITPRGQFEKSMRLSQMERSKRKTAVLASLHQLSSML
jgi:hypothetical protein